MSALDSLLLILVFLTPLYAVNLCFIETYGEIFFTLDLSLHKDFNWIFITADLPYPILRADFLHNYSHFVVFRERKLLDGTTSFSVS